MNAGSFEDELEAVAIRVQHWPVHDNCELR